MTLTQTSRLAVSILASGVVVVSLATAQNPAAPKPVAATTTESAKPAPEARVFELRTYYTHPGRLDALNKRFREHTCALFQKHGLSLVGFWTPQDEKDGKTEKLVYLLSFPSREAAKTSWAAFQNDPEWKAAKAESEKDGPIVKKVESVYLDPTDYSPIK
jgi:hypothetical protein